MNMCMSAVREPVGHAPAAMMSDRLSLEGFAARFEASSRTLWCIAAGVLGRSDQADDVLQEAAIIAMTKLLQFDAGTSFTAWMGCIVRNVALNHARRRRQAAPAIDPHALEAVVAQDQRSPVAPLSGTGELDDARECFDDRVLAGLNTLDETARACLLLRTLLDMPYREISLALDIPQGTAMSHVHRARHQLRDRLFEMDESNVRPGGDR